MAEVLNERREEIATLYFETGSFEVGHEWEPSMVASPQQIFDLTDLIGAEFHYMCEGMKLDPTRIAAIPDEPLQIGEYFADMYPDGREKRLLTFTKWINPVTGEITFTGPEPDDEHDEGDELVVTVNHLTDATDVGAFIDTAERAELVVPLVLCAIDQQRSMRRQLEARGVRLASILTFENVLDVGVKRDHIYNTEARGLLGDQDQDTN